MRCAASDCYRSFIAMPAAKPDTNIADAQAVACPKCSAQLMFARSPTPRIDACGFESYRIECKECGAPMVGIVDPADEALLLSPIAD